MSTFHSSSRQQRSRTAAFTLIELLAVMAIILILAGLILSIAGNANTKAASARAEGQIKALTAAMESYKADNGAYPRITTANGSSSCQTTDTLNAQTFSDPNATTSPSYSGTSKTLYQIISGTYYINSTTGQTTPVASGTTNPPTAYYHFVPGELKYTGTVNSNGFVDPTTVTAIIDPFGNSFGYSTIHQADLDANASSQQVAMDGYNPTFDLWSTAGYSPAGGRNYPTTVTTTNYNTLWVKNW